jgi:hypothetical protein
MIVALLVSLNSTAQAKEESLLVAGDSWAMFMCLYNSFQDVLWSHGYMVGVVGCNDATRFGGRAVEWGTYTENTVMMNKLTTDPRITTVYFSIGGNDFFANWNTSLTAAQEQVAFSKIAAGMQAIITSIFKVRPDVRILISGYDYGNFKDYSKIISAYGDVYKDMGNPTTGQAQRAVLRLSNVIATLADQTKVFYIEHYGLSQYYYGNKDYNLKPYTTTPPSQISPPTNPTAWGGDPDIEAPEDSLLDLFGLQDAYHPNIVEFYNIALHSFDFYFKSWFKDSKL